MTVNSQRLLLAAAGAAAAGEALYVDEVFSCFLYEGNDSTQTITNGIDLSGEGGLVWTKPRTASAFNDHILVDSERGNNFIKTNSTDANNAIASFNFASTGYTVPNNLRVNDGSDIFGNAEKYVSWTFRKAPGFFDAVQFTTSDTATDTVSHSLGSTPGFIVVKRVSDASGFFCWHRTFSNANNYIRLDKDNGLYNLGQAAFSNVGASSFDFNSAALIGDGHTCIAYVFAHDDQSFGTDSDEAIIKCDGYTGNGTSGNEINVGFEPQWLMIKRTSGSQAWRIFDSMRGIATDGNDNVLFPNQPTDEQTADDLVDLTATGFKLKSTNTTVNGNGDTYVYVAIRRPHKPPEAGTDVFKAIERTGNETATTVTGVGFPLDLLIIKRSDGSGYPFATVDRLRGALPILQTHATSAEVTDTSDAITGLDSNDGFELGANTGSGTFQYLINGSNYTFINYSFRRAPGFFDVVAYTGTGSATTVNHNLGAVPSVVLVKGRDSTYSWYWQHYDLGGDTFLQLNETGAKAGNGTLFNSTLPTSSVFSVGSLAGNNGSGNKYIAYLFGDLAGISKAGTYTGTGSNIGVDCGFTAGARFVVIKRTDSTGDWYLYDSVRGIVGGNDPYLLLNSNAAEVTNTDYIDPLNSGFTVTSSAPAALNASGGTYLFLAIA